MPFAYDTSNNQITMATGDTATITALVDWDKVTAGDVILFAIFDNSTGEDKLCKPVEIVDGEAVIRLCNHDTRDIPAGRYKWNLRIVTDPVYDEGGNVRVDECTDDVITVFDSPPNIKLTNGGARV